MDASYTRGFSGGPRGPCPPPPPPSIFLGFLKNIFEADHRLSGILQSPEGCLCGVGLERCGALHKKFFAPPPPLLSEFSVSASELFLIWTQAQMCHVFIFIEPGSVRDRLPGYFRHVVE